MEIGQPAPLFSLPNQDRQEVNLRDYVGKKNIVLLFYFADFTSVCTKEMCTFRDDVSKLEGLDAQVFGISVDLPFSHKAFADQNGIKYPLLSDFNKEVIKLYDVIYDEILGFRGMPKRAVFVIDKKGIVRYKWVAEKPPIEPNYAEVAEGLKKLS